MEPISYEPISYEPISYEPISYELNVYDRNYEKYVFINSRDLTEDISHSNPLLHRWFHKDIIDEYGKVVKSPYMQKDSIPGVLIINGNTYGHLNGNVKAKLLYKCIPDDKSLPIFLIPYEYNCNKFTKNKYNKYVTFRIKEWINKHPIGVLTNTFGDVNDNEAFYQYQLCCKGLNNSISAFTKATSKALHLCTINSSTSSTSSAFIGSKCNSYHAFETCESVKIIDRRAYEIFSIDPSGCKDIDDAIGITYDGEKTIISVYIANVALLLDHLKLWKEFGNRISTIYLPNGKLPMLPTILSDDLCSLIQLEDRCAYCMDILIEDYISVTFKSVIIRVAKNYTYEEISLLENPAYINILTITKQLNSKYKYVDNIVDSHQVVEFFMIMMNYEASKLLIERQTGIFRVTTILEQKETRPCPCPSLPKYITSLISGSYSTYENVNAHALIGEGLDSYVHITSPIRRLVDLVNLIELQQEYMSDTAMTFSKKWINSIEEINSITKNIKKVQNNCNLLSIYTKEGPNKYTGVIVNRSVYKEDIMKYTIYLPDLKMVSTIKTREKLDNYSSVVVSTHSFIDENNIIKKIRLQLLVLNV